MSTLAALESLEAINTRLRDMGIKLALSRSKAGHGPPKKAALHSSDLTEACSFSQHEAYVHALGKAAT